MGLCVGMDRKSTPLDLEAMRKNFSLIDAERGNMKVKLTPSPQCESTDRKFQELDRLMIVTLADGSTKPLLENGFYINNEYTPYIEDKHYVVAYQDIVKSPSNKPRYQ
jgi:hypothetical protein